MDRTLNKSAAGGTERYYKIGSIIAKRDADNLFYRLNEGGAWEFAPGITSIYYDAASDVEEITDPGVIQAPTG